MYIIIPVIIITIIVAISFGAGQFRNVDFENTDASSIGEKIANFLGLNLNLRNKQKEDPENNVPPRLLGP